MKKKISGSSVKAVALLLAIALTGCGSSASESTTDEGSANEISTNELTEENIADDNSLSLSETASGQEDDERNSIDFSASEDDFLTAMDECAGVWPGSAGSSLREAVAAGMLLDWAETYGDLLSSNQVEEFTRDWIESRSDDDLEYLREAWDGIVSAMQTMAEDPDGQSDVLGDAGYTLKYDAYDYGIAEAAIEVIAAVLQQ